MSSQIRWEDINPLGAFNNNHASYKGHVGGLSFFHVYLADEGWRAISNPVWPTEDAVWETADRAKAECERVLAKFLESISAVLVNPGQDTDHVYLSTGCLHGEMVLPDGRTGHEYCQSETGHCGEKTPGTCKFCGTSCTCPCHRTKKEETK